MLANGVFCKLCVGHIKTDCYKRHFDKCDNFKGILNVFLPKQGKTFKLNAFYARKKAPFVRDAVSDLRQKLSPHLFYPQFWPTVSFVLLNFTRKNINFA